jgi:uncharacterized membrane protein
MPIVAVLAASVAALVHVWFFALESVLIERPTVFRRFGLRSPEDAAIVRPMAFNQGFYNLFLAIGIVVGPAFVAVGQVEAEGADLLMVKPAGPYLDVIRELRDQTLLPLVAFQVSGEYSQLHAAAKLGWLDLERVRDESLLGIKRAGADLIITYFAKEIAQGLRIKH